MRKTTIGIFILLATSGCVMQKQYDNLLTEKVRMEADLSQCKDSVSALNTALENFEAKNKSHSEDNGLLKSKLKSTESSLASITQQHEELNKYYDNLRNNSGQLNKNLVDQQQELLTIRESLEKTRQINDVLNTDLVEREKKVAELEKILQDEANATRELKSKISNSLLSFDESDLQVTTKNGKVYVSLSEKLLFKSGSISVDPKGVSALTQLANALKSQEHINVMVEGHTDNIPVSKTTAHMKDNWDLSVLRATSIVKILAKSGVSKEQIIAAGKGEYSPVADNSTAESRQKNRRTDIIITPDLSKLFEMLNVE
jgi:chemotaxis protein MotB